MSRQGGLFVGLAVFFAVSTIIYGVFSHDPTGTTALAVSFGMSLLVGGYLVVTSRRVGSLPEDDPDALVEDHSGEVGFFSPGSHWPLFLATAVTILGYGVAFGAWLMIIGAGLTAAAAIGFVFEYYRGRP